MKGDPMDLRLDIERRKKYPAHERDHNPDQGRDHGDSSDFGRGRPKETISKYCNISKSDKKRSRSSSSSSSSSSKSPKDKSLPHGTFELKDEVLNRAGLDQQWSPMGTEGALPQGGFFQKIQIRGRGWNKGGNQGNGSYPVNRAGHPESEDWDPKFTPKNKTYYLHDDRESMQLDNSERGRENLLHGRTRFIIRKATGTVSPKWAHDKFQANREPGGKDGEEADQDHKEEEVNRQKP